MQPGSAPQGGSLSQQNIYFWILQTEDPAPDYSFPSCLQQLKKKKKNAGFIHMLHLVTKHQSL